MAIVSRLAVVLLLLTIAWPSAAQPGAASPKSPEAWAQQQIEADHAADFSAKDSPCAGHDAPGRDDENGWDDPCRTISADFVRGLLIPLPRRDASSRHDVAISHAYVTGALNLKNMHVRPELLIEQSRFDDDVDLTGTHLDHRLSLDGSRIMGSVIAERVHADDGLSMAHARVDDDVSLLWANVSGLLNLQNSTLIGTLSLNSAHVTGSLFLRGGQFLHDDQLIDWDDDLVALQVDGILDMDAANFSGKLSLDSAHVKGSALMRKARFAGDANFFGLRVDETLSMDSANFNDASSLASAHVTGLAMLTNTTFRGFANFMGLHVNETLIMTDATFNDRLEASGIHIGGDLLMPCHFKAGTPGCVVDGDGSPNAAYVYEGPVDMRNATIGGQLNLAGAHFLDKVDMHGMHVGTSVFATDGTQFERAVNLDRVQIDDSLMLASAKFFGDVDLTSAHIARDLRLSDNDGSRAQWLTNGGSEPRLILHNARAASIVDDVQAWPEKGNLDLDGFIYDHPPGDSSSSLAARWHRDADDWKKWLERDSRPNVQPYTQLAMVLAASGDRDTADDVQFMGRERERDAAWADGECATISFPIAADANGVMTDFLEPVLPKWSTTRCAVWLGYSVLSNFIGYGIGYRTFRVLVWVVVLWLVGVAVLEVGGNTRRKGVHWCVAASLDRMLPIIELDEAFRKYLGAGNLEGDRPNRVQVAYFWLHTLLGWVLGLLLIAAITGITQKP